MFQPKFRRTFAALALTTTLTSLLPLSGLQAMPLRQRQFGEEARATERSGPRGLSLWGLLLDVWEKLDLGARIDDNG
jgi:hypothetical protein